MCKVQNVKKKNYCRYRIEKRTPRHRVVHKEAAKELSKLVCAPLTLPSHSPDADEAQHPDRFGREGIHQRLCLQSICRERCYAVCGTPRVRLWLGRQGCLWKIKLLFLTWTGDLKSIGAIKYFPHTYTVVRQTVRNVDLRWKLLIRRLRRPVESGFALYRSQDSRLSCSTSIGIQLKMVNTLPFDSAMPTHYLRHSFDDKKFDLQTMEGIMFLTVQIDYSNEWLFLDER